MWCVMFSHPRFSFSFWDTVWNPGIYQIVAYTGIPDLIIMLISFMFPCVCVFPPFIFYKLKCSIITIFLWCISLVCFFSGWHCIWKAECSLCSCSFRHSAHKHVRVLTAQIIVIWFLLLLLFMVELVLIGINFYLTNNDLVVTVL